MTETQGIGGRLAALHAEIGNPGTAHLQAAEVLVASAYAGRDRDVWGGDRALTFWDRFPDRVRACCYRGPTLGHWWDGMSRELGCQPPHRAEDRLALVRATNHTDQYAVLDVLRTQADTVCLRVRLAWQLTKGLSNPAKPATTTEEIG